MSSPIGDATTENNAELINFDRKSARPSFSLCASTLDSCAKRCVMPVLMICCPQTGREVSTGIETDPESFQKIPNVLIRTRCPHCGLEHALWRDDAWLAGGSPPQDRSDDAVALCVGTETQALGSLLLLTSGTRLDAKLMAMRNIDDAYTPMSVERET